MDRAESPRFRISHARFSVLFCGLVYWVCNAINMDKLAQWFPQKGGYDFVALAAYLLAGQCLFLVFFMLLADQPEIATGGGAAQVIADLLINPADLLEQQRLLLAHPLRVPAQGVKAGLEYRQRRLDAVRQITQ